MSKKKRKLHTLLKRNKFGPTKDRLIVLRKRVKEARTHTHTHTQYKPRSRNQKMDRAATASRGGDFYTSDPHSTASPDPEARGRKRRRDPLNNPFSLPRHKPSGESSTLRGRCRHRSASRMHLVVSTLGSSTTSTASNAAVAAAAAAAANVVSPELLSPASAESHHRRSRSPSRSRSPGRGRQLEASEVMAAGQRRRQGRRQQRTQSRGRRHGLRTGALALVVQTGRPSLGYEEWVTEDGEREKD